MKESKPKHSQSKQNLSSFETDESKLWVHSDIGNKAETERYNDGSDKVHFFHIRVTLKDLIPDKNPDSIRNVKNGINKAEVKLREMKISPDVDLIKWVAHSECVDGSIGEEGNPVGVPFRIAWHFMDGYANYDRLEYSLNYKTEFNGEIPGISLTNSVF